MPRQRIIYTNRKPFYLSAQSLDANWSGVPLEDVWKTFSERFEELRSVWKLNLKIHGFVLVGDRYHLLATAPLNYDLQYIAERIQGGTSLKINAHLGQVSYAFKREVDFKVIENKSEFKKILKYLFRVPIELGSADNFLDYKFSNINKDSQIKRVKRYKKDRLIGEGSESDFIKWIEDENDPDWSRFDVYKSIDSKFKVQTY